MQRVFAFTGLLLGFAALTAFFWPGAGLENESMPYNTAVLHPVPRVASPFPVALNHILSRIDTNARPEILMLNYSAYNAQYAEKVERYIRSYWPRADVMPFWEGSAALLESYLADRKIVVIPYAADGAPEIIRSYGEVLKKFTEQGGVVIITGSHVYSVIQQYGLIEFDYGYFCRDLEIEANRNAVHAVMYGIPEHFTLANFAYPLDISDPAFVALAEVRDYPVLGYKSMGAGQIFYLGLEYFYDEAPSSMVLANAVHCAIRQPEPVYEPAAPVIALRETPAAPEIPKPVKVVPTDLYNLKVYPNPYAYKASVEIELRNPAVASLELTDETGRVVATPLSHRNLSAGAYKYELPNLPPGIYFLQYQLNEYTTVRKVVKVAAP